MSVIEPRLPVRAIPKAQPAVPLCVHNFAVTALLAALRHCHRLIPGSSDRGNIGYLGPLALVPVVRVAHWRRTARRTCRWARCASTSPFGRPEMQMEVRAGSSQNGDPMAVVWLSE